MTPIQLKALLSYIDARVQELDAATPSRKRNREFQEALLWNAFFPPEEEEEVDAED